MSSTSPLSHASPGAPQPEAPPPTQGGRDTWFDNAKIALVTLVVVGHSWTLLPDHTARHWVYDFLYLWHMPAFVLVTGHLSRSFTWTRQNLVRLVTVVGVPYVVFEAAMAAFRIHVGGEGGIERLFIQPHWPMWFLAALFLWRLATPLILTTPAPVSVAVVVSLLGGLLAGDILDIGRATAMLPFFVIGLVATKDHIELLRRRTTRAVAACALVVAFGAAFFVDGRMRTEWMYWRSGYDAMGVSFAEGALIRLGLLVAAVVLALSALALVPRGAAWFTRLGTASMVVYLFHGFAIRGAEYSGAMAWASQLPWLGLVVATAASVALALALAAPPVARRLQAFVDPVGAWRRTASGDLTDWPTTIAAASGTRPLPAQWERKGPVSIHQLR